MPSQCFILCPLKILQNQRYSDVLQISNLFYATLQYYKFQKIMSVDINDKRKLQAMNNTITYQ